MAVVGEMRKLTIGGNTYTITIPTKLSQFQNDSGYTSNIGTITSVKTTAGTHTTINTSSGAVSFNVPTTAAHVGINFGYTTSGNNRAVQQDNSGNLYVVQKDNNTTYSAGTGLSLSSTTFSVKLGYTTSGNNRAVQADDNGNLYVVQKDDNTTYSSKEAVSGGTEVSLVTTGEKYLWNSKTTNTGTVTSVAASGSGGISISGSPITSSGTIAIGLNLSTAINGLGEGTSAAQRDDYIVAQYAGGGTTTTTYHRRKLSNIFKALNASDITTALGYTPYNAANPNGYTTNTGTITKVTAGVGLNTTSNDTATDGGDITTTGTLYLTKSGASAGSYGDSGNQTPSYGSTFKVPYVTVDKYGRVTAISEHTVKIPASDNSNTTYTLSNALASHTFTETLTAGGSGSGTSTAAMTFAASTGIELTDDTTNKKITIKNIGVTSITTSAGAHSTKSSVTGAVSFSVPTKTSHLTNDSDYTTKSYVDTAIANLPEPMIFKGSLGSGGTITSLPAASAENEGYTYKVITNDTYASQQAKIGDTFISDGTAWVLIPSGDEPSGTVTSITLKAGGGISIDSESAITTSGTRTISHADTSSQASISASGRRYITAITLDTYGHVTSLSTGTETVVNTDEKIKLTTQSTAGSYPLIFGPTSITSDSTYQGYYNTNITYNPNTKELSTGGKINGYTLAAASAKSVDTTISAASTSGNLPTSAAVASFVEGKGYITSYTNTTYSLTQDSSDGHKITLTPSSGTAQTITIPDNNTWRPVQNNLTSDSTTDALSAAQGKALKAAIDGKAASNHTHTTAIEATPNATNQVTLAANTKYTLTAGGTTYVFTTPSDNNTWRGIQNVLTSDSTTDSLSAAQGKALANGSARDNTKLPLAGGTMTGVLTTKGSMYEDSYSGAINMNNSNIYGLNSIYTADTSDSPQEGIHFYRDSTHVDTFYASGGNFYVVPNRELGTNGTARKIYHEGNKPTASDVGALSTSTTYVSTVTTIAGAHSAITSKSGAVSFNVPTTAAHVGIKFNYSTSGNNRAVLQDSSGNLYVTQKDDNTWRGIQDNLTSSTNSSESLSAKQGYLLANGSARDNTKLPLTGGTVTGPVTFGDSVTIDEATIGDLTVNGNGSFTNNLQVNTINGVVVGNSPKFTDLNYYHSAGSWTGLTYRLNGNGGASNIDITLPITVSTSSPTSSDGNNGDLWFTYTA